MIVALVDSLAQPRWIEDLLLPASPLGLYKYSVSFLTRAQDQAYLFRQVRMQGYSNSSGSSLMIWKETKGCLVTPLVQETMYAFIHYLQRHVGGKII